MSAFPRGRNQRNARSSVFVFLRSFSATTRRFLLRLLRAKRCFPISSQRPSDIGMYNRDTRGRDQRQTRGRDQPHARPRRPGTRVRVQGKFLSGLSDNTPTARTAGQDLVARKESRFRAKNMCKSCIAYPGFQTIDARAEYFPHKAALARPPQLGLARDS